MRRIILDQRDRVAAWVTEQLGADSHTTPEAYAMGVEEDGKLIAGVSYDNYSGRNVFMHVAAMPGKNWLTRTLLWHIFNYPFVSAGVDRVTAPIRETNRAARRFVEHIGFTEECRLVGTEPDWSDTVMYVMWRKDCKYLGAGYVRSI